MRKSQNPKKIFAKKQKLMVNFTPSILQIHGKFYYSPPFFDSKNDGKFHSFLFLWKDSMISFLVSLLVCF